MKIVYSVLIALAGCILVAAIVIAAVDWPRDGDWGQAGSRGDFWGGHFSAAGSLVAAFLLVVAILLQREELQAQREELRLTREEMRLERGVHQKQADLLERQAKIADRAAVLSLITGVLRYRADMEIAATPGYPARAMSAQQLSENILPFLNTLLAHKSITDEERKLLAKAFGLPG